MYLVEMLLLHWTGLEFEICILFKKRSYSVCIFPCYKMAAPIEFEPKSKKQKVIKSVLKDSDEKRLIVVLEKASLETVKVSKLKLPTLINKYINTCIYTVKLVSYSHSHVS